LKGKTTYFFSFTFTCRTDDSAGIKNKGQNDSISPLFFQPFTFRHPGWIPPTWVAVETQTSVGSANLGGGRNAKLWLVQPTWVAVETQTSGWFHQPGWRKKDLIDVY